MSMRPALLQSDGRDVSARVPTVARPNLKLSTKGLARPWVGDAPPGRVWFMV